MLVKRRGATATSYGDRVWRRIMYTPLVLKMCLCTRVREGILKLYRVHTAKTGKILSTTDANTYAPVTFDFDDSADQWQFWGSNFAHSSLTTAISWRKLYEVSTNNLSQNISNNQNKIRGCLSQWNCSYFLHLSSLLMTKQPHLHDMTFWHLFVVSTYSVWKSNRMIPFGQSASHPLIVVYYKNFFYCHMWKWHLTVPTSHVHTQKRALCFFFG